MQAVGTKNRTSLHSIDDSVLKTRGTLSMGSGGHVRKRRRGSLSFGISTALQPPTSMILSHRHMDCRALATWNQLETRGFVAIGIEEHLLGLPPQDNLNLARPRMPMHRYQRHRLHRIQHPLTPLLRAVAQVIIHPPAQRRFRLPSGYSLLTAMRSTPEQFGGREGDREGSRIS